MRGKGKGKRKGEKEGQGKGGEGPFQISKYATGPREMCRLME